MDHSSLLTRDYYEVLHDLQTGRGEKYYSDYPSRYFVL